MSAGEWANLQYALLDVFGPLIHWWIILLMALGAFNAITVVWLALLRWLARTRFPSVDGGAALRRMGRLVGMDWDW